MCPTLSHCVTATQWEQSAVFAPPFIVRVRPSWRIRPPSFVSVWLTLDSDKWESLRDSRGPPPACLLHLLRRLWCWRGSDMARQLPLSSWLRCTRGVAVLRCLCPVQTGGRQRSSSRLASPSQSSSSDISRAPEPPGWLSPLKEALTGNLAVRGEPSGLRCNSSEPHLSAALAVTAYLIMTKAYRLIISCWFVCAHLSVTFRFVSACILGIYLFISINMFYIDLVAVQSSPTE